MPTRTTTTFVTFQAPFRLTTLDSEQPAGTYRVETDEEQLEGLSFNAFHRTSMRLYLPADPAPGMTRQSVQIDPQELTRALATDASR
jgi:hypothetical protein